MPNFIDEYYKQPNSAVSIILTEKQMGKKFLKLLSKIFSKKYENIDVNNYEVDELTRTAFNGIASKLSTNFLSKSKKEKFKFFVKNLYNGRIKNITNIDTDAVELNNSSIFKLNNGSRIVLISTTDEDGMESYFIGTDNIPKTNNWFIEQLGQTYPIYVASKKILRKKKPLRVVSKEIEDEPKKINIEIKKDKTHKPEPEKKLHYVVNTNNVVFDEVVNMWGDGRKGFGYYKDKYKYKYKFKRLPFENNWGSGFKYVLPGDKNIYVLQNYDDREHAKIIFDDKITVARAKNMDMMPLQYGTKRIWDKLDINDMGGDDE